MGVSTNEKRNDYRDGLHSYMIEQLFN